MFGDLLHELFYILLPLDYEHVVALLAPVLFCFALHLYLFVVDEVIMLALIRSEQHHCALIWRDYFQICKVRQLQVVRHYLHPVGLIELQESLDLNPQVLLLLLEAPHSLIKQTTCSTIADVGQSVHFLTKGDDSAVQLDVVNAFLVVVGEGRLLAFFDGLGQLCVVEAFDSF